jgi:hypothetical protein
MVRVVIEGDMVPLTKKNICTGNEGGKKRDTRKEKNALQKLRGSTFISIVGSDVRKGMPVA